MPSYMMGKRHTSKGNTLRGQRGSRYIADIGWAHARTSSRITCKRLYGVESFVKLPTGGVYAGQSLSFTGEQEGHSRTAMIDNRDSGKPIVRDGKGALRKRGLWGN